MRRRQKQRWKLAASYLSLSGQADADAHRHPAITAIMIIKLDCCVQRVC